MSRFQFVADHSGPFARAGWSVKRLCALLDLQRSAYYAYSVKSDWVKAGRSRCPFLPR